MKANPQSLMGWISCLLLTGLCASGHAERLPDPGNHSLNFAWQRGYPERGADIDADQLDYFLPPPSRDAVPYEVREPLRNGWTVSIKKRWLWVPDDKQVEYRRADESDEPESTLIVPEGTLWWKEFYLETSAGSQLVERRILRKTSGPDGWRVYTAHFLPTGANGDTGNLSDVDSFLWTGASERYFFRPDQWMPTVKKSAHTQVNFYDHTGARYPYIFPGNTACVRCHNGANATHYSGDGERVLAYGLHPRNLTTASLKNFINLGVFDAESFEAVLESELTYDAESFQAHALLENIGGEQADPQEVMEARTRQLQAMLRNNCLSCHNHDPEADARVAAFKMDPNRDYTTQELVELLSASALRSPSSKALPILTPGQPEQSELYLRVIGEGGR